MNSDPCAFCQDGEGIELTVGVTVCQVCCKCGLAAPNVAPGDQGCETDNERKLKAIELWNFMAERLDP